MSNSLRGAIRRALRLENRRAAIRAGTLEHIVDFESRVLANKRQITIYLPPGYSERADRRYPVLYMQDGQNLFEGDRAFIPGVSWKLHHAADGGIADRTVEALIIVGIDNAGAARADEYTPWRDKRHRGGGRADFYSQMLLEELKPLIDSRYRTRTEAEQTGVGGSSLGGLFSLHAGLRHPDVFHRVASMSPSVWWDDRVIIREVDAYTGPVPWLWLDVGGREGIEALRDVRSLRDHLAGKGWTDELHFHEDRRGDHSERAWARRSRPMLEFLFPPA